MAPSTRLLAGAPRPARAVLSAIALLVWFSAGAFGDSATARSAAAAARRLPKPAAWVAARRLPADVRLTSAALSVPPSFSGLSFEYSELPSFEKAAGLADRVISLIRPTDGEPVVLRVGGKSADDAYWKTPTSGASRWVFEIGDSWLGQLSQLTRRNGLHVMLDLNLAVHSPRMAASLAHAAVEALPAGSLIGLSVGNEPDLYVHEPGLARERVIGTLAMTPTHWTRGYSPASYWRDYGAYAAALTEAVPGIPLAAPEMTASRPEWLRPLRGPGLPNPRLVTIHAYASSICWPASSTYYPSIAALLSEAASAGLAGGLHDALALARSTGRRLRVTEFNSVSCGGRAGVTDSFASALWALDALFEMLKAGVTGVNWHVRPGMANSPFALTQAGIQARPELYGLAVFARMIGTGARLVRAGVTTAPGLHLKVWAVRAGTVLRVLLINKGAGAALARLHIAGAGAAARVLPLRAPSVKSRTDVTFAGRWIGSDARWHGADTTGTVRERRGAYVVRVPGYSAALFELGSPWTN